MVLIILRKANTESLKQIRGNWGKNNISLETLDPTDPGVLGHVQSLLNKTELYLIKITRYFFS
jgi:hypothetical protein